MTFIEQYPQNKKSTVAIKPYFNPNVENMGLEKYGLSLFEGIFHEEQLACIERNGVVRYLTGLNEYAPELRELDEADRDAKIRQIRVTVSQLEKELAANDVHPDDVDFWNKVVLLKPNNAAFWDQIKIRCSNEPVSLTPESDPYDLIKLYAIEAGGFSMVARSLEHAGTFNSPPKFYLDKLEDTAGTKTEVAKLRNKAGAELQKLYDKNANKMFYVAKLVDPHSTQYKKSTPNDVIYENLDLFIQGMSVEKDKRKTASRFLEIAGLDMETLKVRSIVKDATYYKFIATKADGFIYHMATGSLLGRTPSDVAEYLKNPLHEEILTDLTKKVEKYWNM